MALSDIARAATTGGICGFGTLAGVVRAIRDAAEFDRVLAKVSRATGDDYKAMRDEATQLSMTTWMSPLRAAQKIASERARRAHFETAGVLPSEPWPRK